MTLREYAAACKTTMGYPKDLHPLVPVYPALALCGEAGEFSEKVKKIVRDHDKTIPLSAEQRTGLLNELGDVLWYVTAAAEDLGASLEDVARANLDKLQSRKARGTLRGSGDNR
jgi:NTP pyrophosphatase (non-canonical NTP hydrolase)